MTEELTIKEPSQAARMIAAQCWCQKDTSDIVMDARLAEVFAMVIDPLLDTIEEAWGLIAHANVDWDDDSIWAEAARKLYFARLALKSAKARAKKKGKKTSLASGGLPRKT